ncbi:unnamed protein product [Polarella glacialis]|uniref:C3H1-type domain-containing protein n=1 Tax=Polarella glacialis TaxID=89957 RepID=A0A813LKA7_POLGL|nr:unnamed protein product [Polarella glacialis]CAE8733382.1 unnamed protein product [Polarella glacialis]
MRCFPTCCVEETETDLAFAQSPEAVTEHRSVQRLCAQRCLNLEPSVLRCAIDAPPGFEDLAAPAVQAPQTWSIEEQQQQQQEPRSLPLAPPGVRFLTTWPCTAASPSAASARAGSDDPVLFVPVSSATPTHVGTEVLSGACHDVALVTSAFEGFGLQGIAEEVQPQIMTDWSLDQSRGQWPSIGSTCQNGSKCRPCSFFTKYRGCHDGVHCLFCHLCRFTSDDKRLQRLRQRRQRAGATVFAQPQPTTDS